MPKTSATQTSMAKRLNGEPPLIAILMDSIFPQILKRKLPQKIGCLVGILIMVYNPHITG